MEIIESQEKRIEAVLNMNGLNFEQRTNIYNWIHMALHEAYKQGFQEAWTEAERARREIAIQEAYGSE